MQLFPLTQNTHLVKAVCASACVLVSDGPLNNPMLYMWKEAQMLFFIHYLNRLKSSQDIMYKSNLLVENENDLVTWVGTFQPWL